MNLGRGRRHNSADNRKRFSFIKTLYYCEIQGQVTKLIKKLFSVIYEKKEKTIFIYETCGK